MKFNVNIHDFLNAINEVKFTIGKHDVLKKVIVIAKDNKVKLATTNLDQSTIVEIEAEVEITGSMLIPMKLTLDLLKNMTSNLPKYGDYRLNVELDEDNKVLLSLDDMNCKISSEKTTEFPAVYDFDVIYNKIEAKDLVKGLEQVVYSCSKNENNPVLCGVYFDFSNEENVLSATDCKRLTTYSLDQYVVIPDSLKNGFIVPSEAVKRIIGLSKNAETINLARDKNNLYYNNGNVTYVTRLIEGHYPDYKRIITNSFATNITFSKTVLLKSLKILEPFTDSVNSSVYYKFDATGKSVTLLAGSVESGEIESIVNCDSDTTFTDNICLNLKYVMEYLKSADGDTVVMHLNRKNQPVSFTGENYSHNYIVMPIRR